MGSDGLTNGYGCWLRRKRKEKYGQLLLGRTESAKRPAHSDFEGSAQMQSEHSGTNGRRYLAIHTGLILSPHRAMACSTEKYAKHEPQQSFAK